MLTPSSTFGINLNGVPDVRDIVTRLSMGCVTIAHRPKPIGARRNLKPLRASLRVSGADALQTELLSDSPTLCLSRRVVSGGRI